MVVANVFPRGVTLQVAGLQPLETVLTYFDRDKCEGGTWFELHVTGVPDGARGEPYREGPITAGTITCGTPDPAVPRAVVNTVAMTWTGPAGNVTLVSSADRHALRRVADGLRAVTKDQWITAARGSPIRVSAHGELGPLGRSEPATDDAVCTLGHTADLVGPDGLPALSEVVTDQATAEAILAANRDRLLADHPEAMAATVGPGLRRAWTTTAGGQITVVEVRDFAIILHLRSVKDCPRGVAPFTTFIQGIPILYSLQ